MAEQSSPPTTSTTRLDLPALTSTGGMKWQVPPGWIGASVGEMDFPTADIVVERLHDVVNTGLFGYVPPALHEGLRHACSDWMQEQYHWSISPGQVDAVADVLRALELMITATTTVGDGVIVPTPAYMPFLTIPASLGRRVIEVPYGEDPNGVHTFDPAALREAFHQGGRLLILCNPANPVGRSWHRAELEAVAELVEAEGGVVFADEIHAPLTYRPAVHTPYASVSPAAAGHTISATSASKAWNFPGLKCAQVIHTSERLSALWDRFRDRARAGASTLGIVANTVAYTEGGRWLADVLATLRTNREQIAHWVGGLPVPVSHRTPEATYFAWLDLRRIGRDDVHRVVTETARVDLTDGTRTGSAGAGFLRLNFATTTPGLGEILARLDKALAEVGHQVPPPAPFFPQRRRPEDRG
ncbi:MalY/PatB family protein [Pseudonocardia sp. RS010]|uniref:MalY/PatB family protein n=1 Tax=Pseudonocardia sp. RS010 TaxID=3385979 RepID=UPI00399F5451